MVWNLDIFVMAAAAQPPQPSQKEFKELSNYEYPE
jgi:hypothetical protein